MSTHGDSDSRGKGGTVAVAAAWGQRWWRALVAELAGTALLLALGAASLLPGPDGPAPLTHAAFAFGFLVVALAAALGSVSGAHLNPAVTLAAACARRLPAMAAVGYVLAQMAGAAAGFAMLAALAPGARVPGAGLTLPAPALSAGAAALVEALLTAPLCLVCLAAWAAPQDDPTVPIKVGLAVAALIYAGGGLTGASLNPARSFAPALYHADWRYHWVYWLGPLGGALLAAGLHALLAPRERRTPPRAAELAPLRDKLDAC